MSVWVAEEILRRGLRFCRGRSPWQQRSFLGTTFKEASSPLQQLGHCLDTRKWSPVPVSPVRFYSLSGVHSEDLEEKEDTDLRPHHTASKTQSPPSFIERLQPCGSPSDVLDLVFQGTHTPTVRQISNCLTHMWFTTKKLSEDQRRYELQLTFEHPAFERLLQMAMKRVVHMRNEELAYSLLGMVKLGVPQQSRVVQMFLRCCQEKLNHFDEKSLSILASCLEHMEDCTNVIALKEGMRLAVDARLPGIKNVMTLQTMMRLLGKDAPHDLKRKLERKALSLADQFTLPNTNHMISTMAIMEFYSKPLLDVCSKKIKENLNGIPFNILLKVLQSCNELHYRDVDLLNGISDYVASTIYIWSQKQVLLFLSAFEKLVFCPAALMEVFAEKVIANPHALTRRNLLCVLKVYSSLNYDLQHRRQQFLDSVSQALDSYLPQMSSFELLKSVYHLCVLGHFPSAPLEQLLHSSTLEKFSNTAPEFVPSQERMLQTVNLCLLLERPPLPGPLTVPSSVLGVPSPQAGNPWLSQALQSLLGDQDNTVLQENVVVEDFYLIDAVVTKPAPNQASVTAASSGAGGERSPAESSQRIAVLCVPHFAFCYATTNPRGHLAVKIRHLKILGYQPVLVTVQEMRREETRLDLLRERIFPELPRPDPQPEVETLGC